jgi:hypothetical protein
VEPWFLHRLDAGVLSAAAQQKAAFEKCSVPGSSQLYSGLLSSLFLTERYTAGHLGTIFMLNIF